MLPILITKRLRGPPKIPEVICQQPLPNCWKVYGVYPRRGSIREKLLSQQGITFDPSIMYMLANDHNYEEEKIVDGGETDE